MMWGWKGIQEKPEEVNSMKAYNITSDEDLPLNYQWVLH
jgi:hypothetical protein